MCAPSYILGQAGEEIGSIPCKNIICDVPFEGNVDRSSSKPASSKTNKVNINITKHLNIYGVSNSKLYISAKCVSR